MNFNYLNLNVNVENVAFYLKTYIKERNNNNNNPKSVFSENWNNSNFSSFIEICYVSTQKSRCRNIWIFFFFFFFLRDLFFRKLYMKNFKIKNKDNKKNIKSLMKEEISS